MALSFASRPEANAAEMTETGTPRILFIGNSFTSHNHLPAIFKGLCEAAGYHPYIHSVTKGGQLLEYHANPENPTGAKVYKQLTKYTWDYVIMQDQRYTPMTAPETSTFPACRILDNLIRNSGGQTVFYMTWGYETDSFFTIDGVSRQLTMHEIQDYLSDSYYTIGNELGALVAPAGISFMRCREIYPEISLWQPDGYHPTPAGSYLAACTLFAAVFEQSPLNNGYCQELDWDTALKLQKIADCRLKISDSNLRLDIGTSKMLTSRIIMSPDNDSVTDDSLNLVTWTSSNPDIVSVNPATGEITALSPGHALITASTESGLINKCSVSSEIFARTLDLTETEKTLFAGDSFPLSYSFTPQDATDTFTFTSDAETIAAVDTNGKITALSPGSTFITVTGSNGVTARCKINVFLKTPENLKAVRSKSKTADSSLTNIKISWRKSTGAAKYTVYRSQKKNGTYQKIGSTTALKYTDKNLKTGKQYFYKIAACADQHTFDSTLSAPVKIRVPSAPQLTVKRTRKTCAALKWKKVKYASGYEIYRSKKKSSKYSLIKTVTNPKRVKYTDKTLKKNKTFYYKIRTYITVNGVKIYSKYSATVKCGKKQ